MSSTDRDKSTERDQTMTMRGGRRPRRMLVIATAVIAMLGVGVAIGVAALNNPEPPPAGVDPVATDPSHLIGTWRPTFIKDYAKLDSARPDPATLTFSDDGKWRGSDGCNGIGGTYDADPGEISAKTGGPTTAMWCENVPNDELLGKSAHFRVSGTVLTLYDAKWNRLASYSGAG
jgi:heat shock protein HslJ